MEFCNEEQLAEIRGERMKQKERELERVAKARQKIDELQDRIILEAASDCEKSSLASFSVDPTARHKASVRRVKKSRPDSMNIVTESGNKDDEGFNAEERKLRSFKPDGESNDLHLTETDLFASRADDAPNRVDQIDSDFKEAEQRYDLRDINQPSRSGKTFLSMAQSPRSNLTGESVTARKERNNTEDDPFEQER
jgi:hypothetical protein